MFGVNGKWIARSGKGIKGSENRMVKNNRIVKQKVADSSQCSDNPDRLPKNPSDVLLKGRDLFNLELDRNRHATMENIPDKRILPDVETENKDESGPSILVVDDYQMMRKIIIGILKEMNLSNIHAAESGNAATKILLAKPVDLIIADLKMPKMNGIQLLHYVRTTPEFKKIPFVIVTAESDLTNVAAASKLKVSSYIVKPFSSALFKQRIRAVLANLN